MKPFNLDQALAGKPVVNGLGRRVVDFYCFTDADGDCCIAALLENYQKPLLYSDDGIIYDETGIAELNLYMATTKRTVWAVVIKDTLGKVITMERLYDTEPSAQSAASVLRHNYTVIGVHPLEIEE